MLEYRLSRHKLKRLADHRYSVEGASLLEPFFQVFWRRAVEWLPLWCAPNAVTLVGLIINAFSAGLLMFYSPDARSDPPMYSYALCAIGLFLYQTLDAIDGKQARRTNSSSPLGELFDHGCDSLSMVLVIVSFCIMLQLGNSPGLMFYICFSSMLVFYAAHWQTYCSGTLKFGLLDVTEGQLSIIMLFVVTVFTGTPFWSSTIPWLGLEKKIVPAAISMLGTATAAQNYFRVIFIRGGVGRNGSTVAGTSVLSPLMPIAILLTLGVTLWKKSTSSMFDEHIVLYVMSFGMAAAKVTNKLVVAHMSHSEMEMLDRSLIGPGLLFLNQYFDTYFSEYLILWACFVFCAADLLWYSYNVCTQIAAHLNIRVFHITASPPGGPDSNHLPPAGLSSSSGVAAASPPPDGRRSLADHHGGGPWGGTGGYLGGRWSSREHSTSSSDSADSSRRIFTRSAVAVAPPYSGGVATSMKDK